MHSLEEDETLDIKEVVHVTGKLLYIILGLTVPGFLNNIL